MIPILEIDSLNVTINEEKILKNISFDLGKEEIVGIVGESGSGKSLTAQAILGLLPKASVEGKFLYKGVTLDPKKLRGKKISIVFQNSLYSLNPTMRIGFQIMEAISGNDKKTRALELLNLVGIRDPEEKFFSYPHTLSGGERQRVMIAMSLGSSPDILIADEPTTALDVTIQAQILTLLKRLQKQLSLSILFISHDLGIISQICDRVIVMLGGRIMEVGPTDQIISNPRHPYTKYLLKAFYGESTEPIHRCNSGCPFLYRCERALKICKLAACAPVTLTEGHKSSCWHYLETVYKEIHARS